MDPSFVSNRRRFLTGAALTAGMYGLNLAAQTTETKTEKNSGLLVIGPKPGYTPQVGTLVSMLTYIQTAVTSSVKGLTMADLDYLFDANANTIGALLLHRDGRWMRLVVFPAEQRLAWRVVNKVRTAVRRAT